MKLPNPFMWTRRLIFVAVAATMLTTGACGAASDVQPTATDTSTAAPTTVTLGLYSGVADPTWTLTAGQSRELSSRVAQLSRVPGTAPTGGLGYHGFSFESPEATLIAYAGAVSSVPNTAGGHLSDPDRVIERFLLTTGQRQLTPVEYAEVKQALGG
ncbi:MAG: hypothetical protein WCJ42_02755 [Actinomycetes bacterium]